MPLVAAPGRPFTGAEYLASLRDGREVYIYGERVEDATTQRGSMTRCTISRRRMC
jgi:aromatic ring hydroxylase